MVSKTLRDLEAQLAIREQQIRAMQADIDALRRVYAIMQEAEQQNTEEDAPPAKVIRNTMLEILQEAGKPIHYGEIFDNLVSRGISVPGKDPRRNVGAHLSIDDRFEKQGGGMWGLKSWGQTNPQAQGSRVTTRTRPTWSYDSDVDSEAEDGPTDEEIQQLLDDENEADQDVANQSGYEYTFSPSGSSEPIPLHRRVSEGYGSLKERV